MSTFTRYIVPGPSQTEAYEYKEGDEIPEDCALIREDLITDSKLSDAGFRLYLCIKGQKTGFNFTEEFFFERIRFNADKLKKTIKHLKDFGLMKEGCGWEIFD